MKRLLVQLFCILLLTLVAGTVYNTTTGGSDRDIPFFNTYRNAQVCKKAGDGVVPDMPDEGTEPGPGGEPPDPGPGSAPEDPNALPMIRHVEAHEYWQEEFLFVDARRTSKYEAGHIPGAVSISPYEGGRDEKISKLVESEILEAPVVVYCSKSKDCEDSHRIGEELKAAGFVEVYVYLGGFPDWKENGKPVMVGDQPGRRGGSISEGETEE